MYHNKYLKYKFKYQLLQKKLKGGMKKEPVAQFPEFLNVNINIRKLQHMKKLEYILVEFKSDFFEEQESSACGRHALNNLFGSQIFIHNQEFKDITSINDVLKDITKITKINLYWLCSYIWNQSMYILKTPYIVGDLDFNKFCQPCENYNIIIIIAACNLLGCTVPYYSASDTPGVKLNDNQIDECFNYTLCFGWIINYNRGHWVSLRRTHNNPDMVLYYNSTDKLKKGIEMSLKEYKDKYKSEIYGILPIMYDGKNIVKDYIQELKPVKPLTPEDEILIQEIYKEQEEQEKKSEVLIKQILSEEQEPAPELVKLKPQKSSSLTSNELDDILEQIEQQTKKENEEKSHQEQSDEILAKKLQQKEGCPMQKKYYRQYK
jgi:hypothetical protein